MIMKRIKINAYTVGLVFKNGEYTKCLTAGKYWLGFGSRVRVYDITKPFHAPVELNILLQDEQLAKMLTVIEVQDNEIALQYTDNNFSQVLTPGKYAFWNSLMQYAFQIIDLNELEVSEDMDKAVLKRADIMKYMRVYKVEPYEKALLMVNGEFQGELETGIYRFWNNTNEIAILKADMRQRQMEISGQELLTKDKAGLRMNFYTQFKVTDIQRALLDNKDYEKQLYVTMQLALREFTGTMSLDELLAKKEAVAGYVLAEVSKKVNDLGVEVMDCGVRDIILPGDMKDIMNQVLIAEKQAQANTILRREETAATRSLLNTAKLMEDNAMLMKLKEMEYVEKIAEKIGEITLSGKSQIVDQLTEIFVSK